MKNMDKRYKILITFTLICCATISVFTALITKPSGVLVYPEADDNYRIEFQSDAGSYFGAIITPDEGEGSVSTSDEPAPQPEYTVNINTASEFELSALLPGIGEKKAAAIVEYRSVVGGFNSVEELSEVPGISRSLFNKIKPYCTVGDED